MQGFHHRGEFDPPAWASSLRNYYWKIRVEGRDAAKRRMYYRKIEKEKLLLAECNIRQDLILAVCWYLATLKNSDGLKMSNLINDPVIQLSLNLIK